MKKYLEVGKIVGTHALRGELRVQPWADSCEFLSGFKRLYLDGGNKKMKVTSVREHGNIAIVKLEGVNSVEEADALRGKILYIDRDDAKLPEGRYFVQDLIGLSIVDADNGRVYGTLADISQLPANDVYHVKMPDGKERLIPVIDSVLAGTDLEAGTIAIHAMEGMFDDED